MNEALSRTLLRVITVLGAYAAGAGLLWLLLPRIRRLFLLPALFHDIARGALLVGALVAVAVAWRYPALGDDGRSHRAGEGGGEE